MKTRASLLFALIAALAFAGTALSQGVPSAGDAGQGSAQAAEFARIMRSHGIPGAQMVYAHQGTYRPFHYGVLSEASAQEVDDSTLFQAASLSKVIAAYIALQMVDRGQLDLDRPLWDDWHSPRTEGNAANRKITARMVLNHTTGLPNWQISPSDPAIDRTPLSSKFAPGTQFAYSGEGFYLLQKTIEHLTRTPWNELVGREVFSRFGMGSSSYLTDPALVANYSPGHDRQGVAKAKRVYIRANTAYTLVTNAHDYNQFIQRALYKGEGLKPATHRMMFSPSSSADDASLPIPADPFISWGLGVGIQATSRGKLVWHWGDNPGFKAFFALDPASGDSVILFTNSDNGLSTYKDVLRLFMGEGDYPAVDWASAESD